MQLRSKFAIAAVLAALVGIPYAYADLTYTQGSGTTIFDFVCFVTKHCSAHVPVNSAGTEIATSANPLYVQAPSFSGTLNQSGSSPPALGIPFMCVEETSYVNAGNGQAKSFPCPHAIASTVPSSAYYFSGNAITSEPSAATAGNLVGASYDKTGKQIVLPYANPENFVSGATAAMTGTTSTSLIASPGGSLRNYITHVICSNSHATVGTFVNIQDGSGGTTLYAGYAAAVGGGFSITLPTPLRQPTTATALFVADVTTGANVICSATGYKGL